MSDDNELYSLKELWDLEYPYENFINANKEKYNLYDKERKEQRNKLHKAFTKALEETEDFDYIGEKQKYKQAVKKMQLDLLDKHGLSEGINKIPKNRYPHVDMDTEYAIRNKLREIADAALKKEQEDYSSALKNNEPSPSFGTTKKYPLKLSEFVESKNKPDLLGKTFRLADVYQAASDISKGDVVNPAISAAEAAAPKLGAVASRTFPLLDLLRPTEMMTEDQAVEDEMRKPEQYRNFKKLKKLFSEE